MQNISLRQASKRAVTSRLIFAAALLVGCAQQTPNQQAAPAATLRPRLPPGKYLDPAAPSTQLGSFPMNALLSPEGDRVVVMLSGWREQGLQIVDRASGNVLQTLEQPAAFIGVAFSPDGKTLYASGGN